MGGRSSFESRDEFSLLSFFSSRLLNELSKGSEWSRVKEIHLELLIQRDQCSTTDYRCYTTYNIRLMPKARGRNTRNNVICIKIS